MRGTKSAALILTLIASATLAGTVHGASAAEDLPSRVVLHDGTGDVWTSAISAIDEPSPTITSYPAADVTKAVVTHGHYALRLRLRFANLRRVGHQAYRVDLQTPRADFFAAVVAGSDIRQGRHFLERESTVRCRGFRHEIDYGTDVVTMRIPRRCLGRPRWIKVHLDHALWTGDLNQPDASYEDNPHGHDGYAATFTKRLYRR
jgi:hypothetical protein